MEQPQPCTKCKKLPEDILMLACSHDLCLDCASERLAFEMKKKKPANSIVCEVCYERTALDGESISQLERLIPVPKQPSKNYGAESRTYEKTEKMDRIATRVVANEQKSRTYERQPVREYSYNPQGSLQVGNISTKKSCNDHPQEEILYFCFDCKCECICPECIIHGKHKQHDVKTIKKSSPIIKGQLENSLDKIETSIENYLIKKSQAQKSIRNVSEQNAVSKRQVQSAFEQVKAKLAQQQKEILAKCDDSLNESVGELEKFIKGIIKRIQELKGYSAATNEYMKKQDMALCNFYSKKWKDIQEETKQSPSPLPHISPHSNEKTLNSILQITDYIDRMSPNERKHAH